VAEHKLYGVEYSLNNYSAGEWKSAILNPNIHQHDPKIPPFGTVGLLHSFLWSVVILFSCLCQGFVFVPI